MASDRYPRAGDTILDPSGGHNRVLAVRANRLLLSDANGFQFVLRTRWLYHGWRLQARERKPKRVDERRFAPRSRRERRAA